MDAEPSASTCMTRTEGDPMYDLIIQELARSHVEDRWRTRRVHGIRRSSRLISQEIRRSRQVGHPR